MNGIGCPEARKAFIVEIHGPDEHGKPVCVVTHPWSTVRKPGGATPPQGRRALINPANGELCGTARAYFPRGGPCPPPPPTGLEASSAGWGGMDAGSNMLYPAQVVDGLTHMHAGPELRAALSTLPMDAGTGARCPVGAAVLSAPYKLHDAFDMIAHTPTPFWPGSGDAPAAEAWQESLRACYRSAILALVHEAPLGQVCSEAMPTITEAMLARPQHPEWSWLHIAVPLLGTGAAGAPVGKAAEVAVRALEELALEASHGAFPRPVRINFIAVDAAAADAIDAARCGHRVDAHNHHSERQQQHGATHDTHSITQQVQPSNT